MSQVPRVAVRPFLLASAVALMAIAGPALAQLTDPRADERAEPWRGPEPPPGKPRTATSSTSATQPTEAEQRQARKLAQALFAAPAAGQRAADKAAPPSAAKVPPASPKAEWLAEDKVGPGGEGVQVKTPF
ncbi:MAG: hypothetical protein ACXWK0_15070 [Caulobacteraceae bacterium]